MTHSQDTATPALSVESEEAVAAALWQEEAREGTPKSIWQARTLEAFRDTADINQERWRRFARAALAAAPAPSPSPAAKGGDTFTNAGAFEAAYAKANGIPLEDMRSQRRWYDSFKSYAQPSMDAAWRGWKLSLATPSPQPADAAREALFSAWELDELRQNASAKHLVYLAHHAGVGLKANEVEAMERWGALCNKLAALASDPAPAGEAQDPTVDLMQRIWANLYYDEAEAGFTYQGTLNDVVDWLAARGALPDVAEPAPAGEAVQPVLWSLVFNERYGLNAETTFKTKEKAEAYSSRCDSLKPRVVALFAHPAPEDTARLREDLAEAVRQIEANIAAIERSKEFVQKATALTQTAERERDDARKALETAAEDGKRLDWIEANMNAELLQEGGWDDDDMRWSVFFVNGGRNDREWTRIGSGETVREAIDAARSASREGASDE